MPLGHLEQLEGLLAHAERIQGHHALGGLGGGDPIRGRHAANAKAVHHELVEVLIDPPASGVTLQGSREHRVVPVHGELVLRGEGSRVVRDGMAQSSGCQLPFGPMLAETFGDGHGAAERVVNRRRSGEQRIALGPTGRIERPAD